MQMAASVTPRRHDTGPAVLDKRRDGGDVVGTDKISVPLESTGRTAEPATLRLCNPPPASRTGRRGASLIHQTNLDASLFGLVAQRPHEVGAAPLTQPQVLQSTDIPVGDAFGVSEQQGSYPLFNRKGDSLLCRLVMGLVDAAAMTSLGQATRVWSRWGCCSTGTEAATANQSRPPSASSVTARTCSAG